MKVIAHMECDFSTKFGIPRQSGRVPELRGRILFEPEYRVEKAVDGLEEYEYLWLIWEFSENKREGWSPTVRPPRLGGNVRKGVFATRSPFRPNPLGLSSVKLEKIEFSKELGPVLHVSGADLMDQTPIYDIKPYLPGTDSHPDARGGFARRVEGHRLQVVFPEELLCKIPMESRTALLKVLAEDPRPGYHHDPHREYGMPYGVWDIHFRVDGDVLHVFSITAIQSDDC